MRCLLVACALALVFPAAATAGVSTARDRSGDVRAKGLTRAERSALDIVSVRATGDESNGLFVAVRFRGDVERRLGQGRLKRALVALILRPKSAAQAPSGLVAAGGGYRRARTPRPRRRSIKRFGRERVLRRTRTRRVGIVRRKNRLLFYIRGPGFSNVGSIQVKAFVRLPGRSTGASAAGLITHQNWLRVLDNDRNPADLAEFGVDAGTLNCAELKALRAELAADRAYAQRELPGNEATVKSYKDAIQSYSEAAYRSAKAQGQHYATKAELQEVVDLYASIVKREKAIVAISTRLIRELDGRIKACEGINHPPVITRFTAVFGTYCATCTLYTVTAHDPDGEPLTYSWAKYPPPGGDPPATNCGTFAENRPAPNQAVWDHPNEGPTPCSHAAGEHPGYIAVVASDPRGGQALYTDTHGSAGFTYP